MEGIRYRIAVIQISPNVATIVTFPKIMTREINVINVYVKL